MLQSYKLKEWVRWPAVRAHVCSGALALAFPATWRGPRFAFALGGAPYALAVTLALLGVALPLALLQLAVGQLSQQDAVGVWRAVPFFTGVGYLRLLISLLCSVYSIIYLAMTTTYFLYTISNSLPFWECIELVLDQEDYVNAVNASTCLKDTFMGPVQERPEYYLAVALIILVLWIVFPFIFYNPVKLMKRILYGLGPAVLLLMVVTLACVGDASSLAAMGAPQHWRSFLEPAIWHAAVVHALLATHIAGGFLIAAGDTVYSTTNVQWTAVAVTAANVASTWLSVVFWHALSGAERDAGVFAVLVAAYQLGDDVDTDLAWPLTVFLTLLLSGFITMLALLYPVFERCRRAGGAKWRALGFAGALAGALLSLAALWGRLPALTLLADFVVPLLVSIATLLEILAFVFIYGWKVLVEDVEFLTGNELAKFWVLGWCSAPGIIAPFTAWWLAAELAREPARPGPALALLGAAALALLVLLACAAVAVARQVQYDCGAKLKSSFKPSRHWGPRDPITHYYWLARREHLDRGGVARARYQRRQLGQLSGRPSFLNLSHSAREREEETVSVGKVRSNSDDLLYTVCRKQQARVQVPGVPGTRASGARGPGARARARSLDGGLTLQPLPSMHRDALVTLGLDNTILK
nr:sodium-dependent nutrient amino acid transporter 1 isoform X2 [Helicoverpa armigera]